MIRVGDARSAPPFPTSAKEALNNGQLRRNVRHATSVIRSKRDRAVADLPDWEALRSAAERIKRHTLHNLHRYLVQFEAACTAAGGQVHWARDADEANGIIVSLVKSHNAQEVIKVKTMTSDEIRLNSALESAGIQPVETDLADLIVQLGRDRPSHIVVPALHRNRAEVRELFMASMGLKHIGETPEHIAEAARGFLRERFLRVPVAISGANFAIAQTGSVCVVESEGNGRMCVTLPKVLISLIGIEKLIPSWHDLEVFLQMLPRSATGERMNPYNSIWTGVTPGDGPREFHVVLLDNGRTQLLAKQHSRDMLNCIRCGACLNACPVYRQTGGHAYGSVYGGPIGAILTPQLLSMQASTTLPYASSLCGACYEVCPVKIDIPAILIQLRGEIVRGGKAPLAERTAMRMAAFFLSSAGRLAAAHKLLRAGQIPFRRGGTLVHLPGMLGKWTDFRDLRPVPAQSFRQWWAERNGA